MNHNHNHNHNEHHGHENMQKNHCPWGDACHGCAAEQLAVNCGCDMEAKQFEYKAEAHFKHSEHDHAHADHAGHDMHDMSKMSHMDHEAAMTDPQMAKAMEADMRRRFLISFLLSVPIFLYSPVGINLLKLNLPSPIPVNWLLFLLTTPIVFWAGSIFITGTYYSLRAKKLNMAVLVATGVLAAYLFSVLLTVLGGGETFYEAAALLVTFVLFGHWMEMKSRRGTSEALRALFDLVPPQATVIRDGKEVSIPSADIIKGDIVVIRPGNKIPVDGTVVEGETYIDESLVTGESLPVHKKIGDPVTGGSINQSGSVRFEAVKVGSDTILAQIIKMVETAQNSKAPGQRLADKAAAVLVVVAITSGLAAFFGWYFFAGAAFITALTFAVSTVVIACPDALGLATPTAVAVGTGIGAKRNILIKDATTLEKTSKLDTIVMDKTGTLTKGQPEVTDIVSFIDRNDDDAQNLVLRLAASLEAKSEHPLAKTIADKAQREGLEAFSVDRFEAIAGRGVEGLILGLAAGIGKNSSHPLDAAIAREADRMNVERPTVSEFKATPGYGLEGKVGGGQVVLFGNQRLMESRGIAIGADAAKELERLQGEGKTAMILVVQNEIIGMIAVADTLRETSKQAIKALQDIGIEIVMLSGDNQKTASAIAGQLGIDRVFAEVLPGEKATWVKKLQEEGKFVAMVGDGINDAPALAQANIGIAIGAGTDVAIETGNIVLMKSDPYDIVRAIQLSKATVVKMKQNLFWAAIYNVLAIPVASGMFFVPFGWSLRPEVSALLMSISSIVVALNAVSLKLVEKKL